jgi:preprotein translocase subunit SecY
MSASANPQAIMQAWGVPELQARLKFVLFALFIYCVGIHIPAAGMDSTAVENFFSSGAGAGGLMDFIDIFSGGALSRFSIFALGVMPYINASIMMQLLVAVDARLKEMNQEGEEGRKKVSKITRYLAVGLAFVQGIGFVGAIYNNLWHGLTNINGITALFSVVAGTCFLMWLGDEISQKGVGNGLSILITLGILISVPSMIFNELRQAALDNSRLGALLLFFMFTVVVITAIVWIQLSVRKVPVQYARRQIGRRVYGGQNTYLPMKVAQAGVIPLIFAISVLMVPPTVLNLLKNQDNMAQLAGKYAVFQQGGWGMLLTFVMVFIFTFVYVAVTFNTQDIAENLKKNNGFIPGIRPGRPTFEFLDKVLHRITFFGGLYLGLISILPIIINAIVSKVTNVQINSFYIGGTSLLIVVGVALDTVQQMQAHMVMRHYSGFNK